ncbi:MAG: amidohydrolase family protein [Gemmatimonadota bacterium]|nr:amidohydrolase family protein [Gemmatimonadota bacterium]
MNERTIGRCLEGFLRGAGRIGAAVALAGALVAIPAQADAQNRGGPPGGPPPDSLPDLSVVDYDPRSTLVVPGAEVPRARFPFVDVHLHINATRDSAELDRMVADMDALNLAVGVNLSGGTGDRLAQQVRVFNERYPGRFVVFANVDFSDIDDPEFGALAAERLRQDVENGAVGLKIFKSLGMNITDAAGERVRVDDPRLDPIWSMAGELGIPVLIHTGDPAEFWAPRDEHNERWLELTLRARRKQEAPPTWEELMAEQHRMFRNHPETTFIAAHLGWLGHDLGRLGSLLDELPNMNVGLGAVIYEPGRQPRFANEFFTKYQDRILMGKDSWAPEEYPTYFRVLESDDEYFPYYRRYHAFWRMYGLGLSDEVLRKIYYENALRIIPGIDSSRFPG